jgi:hypothetical protein
LRWLTAVNPSEKHRSGIQLSGDNGIGEAGDMANE